MAPLIAVVIGLAVAFLAGLVSVRAGVSGVVIAQDQIIGITHLVAGAIAWRRRPDKATGALLTYLHPSASRRRPGRRIDAAGGGLAGEV